MFKVERSHDVESMLGYSYRLKEVNDLGDRALSVGYNPSLSMTSLDCVRGDCIYFSEDDVKLYGGLRDGDGHDTGIYDMKTSSVEWHYPCYDFKHPLNPPMWYVV